MTAAITPLTQRWSTLSWTAEELLARDSWRGTLPADVAAEFVAFVARRPGLTEATFVHDPCELPRMAAFGARVRESLLTGDGLFWLRDVGALGLAAEHLRCLFVAMGCALGAPMLQYGRLYPVFDRGASHTPRRPCRSR